MFAGEASPKDYFSAAFAIEHIETAWKLAEVMLLICDEFVAGEVAPGGRVA